MTVTSGVDPARLLVEQLGRGCRTCYGSCSAPGQHPARRRATQSTARSPGPGESAQRVSASRLRHPAGTLDVAIPKLRQGSYLQAWLLERPRRAERALTSVVATCYLLGCRRRMDKLVQSVRITGLSLRSRTACNFLRTLRRAPFSDVCR